VSTMETPPTDPNTIPPAPPERRCPRCGSTLAPDQEWCLSCGAAAGTEVVEARGWRVPLYLGGSLAALAVIGVILAFVALASRKDEVAQNPQPTPGASSAPPGSSPTPLPTLTPAPTASVDPNPTPTPDPSLTPTPTPDDGFGTGTDDGTGNTDDGTGSTDDGTGNTDDGTGTTGTTVGSFAGWSGGDGYTVIIESASSQSGAEKVAQEAQDAGDTVGILKSDEFSSLNAGYWVVFSGEYATKSEAEDALDSLKSSYSDAYVRKVTPSF
jgi:septal ring-binding cell division protein DamX